MPCMVLHNYMPSNAAQQPAALQENRPASVVKPLLQYLQIIHIAQWLLTEVACTTASRSARHLVKQSAGANEVALGAARCCSLSTYVCMLSSAFLVQG